MHSLPTLSAVLPPTYAIQAADYLLFGRSGPDLGAAGGYAGPAGRAGDGVFGDVVLMVAAQAVHLLLDPPALQILTPVIWLVVVSRTCNRVLISMSLSSSLATNLTPLSGRRAIPNLHIHCVTGEHRDRLGF